MERSKEDSCFKIGEVVYILSNKNQNVVPALVVEESTIKTLQGTSTSWKLQIGSGEKAKIVDSTKIDGEIFVNLDLVKDILTKRLGDYISNLISTTKQRQEIWYGKKIQPNKPKKEEPSELISIKPPITKEELRDELKKRIIPQDDETLDEENNASSLPSNIDDFIHHNPSN